MYSMTRLPLGLIKRGIHKIKKKKNSSLDHYLNTNIKITTNIAPWSELI